MKRTRNAVRNVIFGGLLKGYQILVPFIMRTLLIRYLGMEYLGLNSLFTSILQILNLAELGVGSALGYSMYAPIAEGKKDEICALLSLYRRYYRLIGLGIFLAGIVLLPFLPSLVKTDSIPPDVDLYVLYLLHLGACVISYWLFAYKNSLLAAHQRSDLANKADLAVRTLQYLIQAGLLVGFRNYYWYLLAALGAQILTNLCTALVAQKNYPDYVPKGQVEEQTRQKIRGRIKDLFTSRVGVVIVNSADTLVISTFLGLTVLAVYQNYYYIVTSVIGLVGVLFTSTLAGIGNSLLTESRGKNYADFCKFTLLIAWIAGLCTCCLLCLLQPFMKLWIGEAGILPGQIVICLCVYYFIYEFNQLFNAYKDAAGIWHRDRFRTLTTAGVNLVLNLLLVKPMGLYGVILSTVVATLIVGMPWLIHNLFTTLFDGEDRQSYLGTLVFYGSVTFLNCMLTDRVCSQIPVEGIRELLERALVCLLVSNGIFLLCYGGRKDFRALLAMGKRFLPEIPHDKATSGNDRSAEETTKFADYGKAGAFYEDCSSGNRVCGICPWAVSAGPRNHEVTAVDVIPEKVELLQKGRSPIRDKEIKEYLAGGRLHLQATLDGEVAYRDAELVIVSTPTNYDPGIHFFDTGSVETVVETVRRVNPDAVIVIKSTVPVGYTVSLMEKYHTDRILFSPEFLREGHALYDNLYPSRIIVGADTKSVEMAEYARRFAELLREGAKKQEIPIRIMDPTEAEAVKLFANTYLALRVSFF